MQEACRRLWSARLPVQLAYAAERAWVSKTPVRVIFTLFSRGDGWLCVSDIADLRATPEFARRGEVFGPIVRSRAREIWRAAVYECDTSVRATRPCRLSALRPSIMNDPVRLFVYGTFLSGERDHALVRGAKPDGVSRTDNAYTLVDLGPYAALIERGTVAVTGELYVMDRKLRFELDVARQCPILFQRILVRLEDGSMAEAYAMREEQVRGKRRLAHGDWRKRFAPRAVPEHARAPAPFRRLR